ncbi:MAG: ankyrin repeat domain-containing protein [Thermoguttaceae bacterium]
MKIQIQRNGTWQKVSKQELLELVSAGVVRPDTAVLFNDQQIVAARIKGLVFPSQATVPPPTASQAARTVPVPHFAPKQLYCTNCGNAISEQAAACMACGAKPIGHKKFCRQCGVALNPEQVVCIKCGTSVAVPIMADAKRVVQSVMSSSAPFIEKTKLLPKPAIIAGIAGVAVAGIVCLALLLSKTGGGNVNNLSLGDIVPATLTVADVAPPVLTAAERAETDKYIANYGRDAIVRYLMSLGKDKSKNADKNLVLKYLMFFVSQGADVNAKIETKNSDGVTPLHWAAGFGNAAIVKFLVSKGADTKVVERGITLLHIAAENKDVEVAKFLISQGVDVNAKAEEDGGSTPLHAAVEEGNIEVVKFLVSQGADVNAKGGRDEGDVYGTPLNKTPLHIAVEKGDVEVAKFLISQGADVNAKGGNDKTPLHTVVEVYSWKRNTLDPSKREQMIDIIRFLVSKGADVNAKSGYDPRGMGVGMGETPLDLAKGADVNAKSGYDPLGMGMGQGMEEIVQILSAASNSAGQRETAPPPRGDSSQLRDDTQRRGFPRN